MTLGGYANHVARIDLSSGSVSYEGINEEDARLYIGARGLGAKYIFDNDPTIDPHSPGNMLGLVNGPLTGTEATMSGRLAFVTKSPLTGTVTDSHMGGWSAARLRWAGFDALLFTGKAEAPRVRLRRRRHRGTPPRGRSLGQGHPRHRRHAQRPLRRRPLRHGHRSRRRERGPLRFHHE